MFSSPVHDNMVRLRWVMFIGLGSVVLILALNAHNSSLVKLPLLVLTTSLLLAEYLRLSIRRHSVDYPRSPVDIPIVVFLIAGIVSAYLSSYPRQSTQALLLLSSSVVMFFATTQLAYSRKNVERFVLYFAALAGVVVVLGILQYFLAEQLPVEVFLSDDRRIGSTLGNPAFLGGFVVLLLPLALSQALSEEVKTHRRKAMGLLAALLVCLLFLSMSRSSIVAGILSVVLLLALRFGFSNRKLLWGLAGVVIACVLAITVVPQLGQRFTALFEGGEGSTLSRRLYFWKAGYNAAADAPFFGHGIGSYEPVMMRFRSPDYWLHRSEDVVPHAHNEYLQMAAEMGMVGLLISGIILVMVFRAGWKVRTRGKMWEWNTACGLLCGLVAIVIDNLGNVSLRQAPVAPIAWIFMGLLVARGLQGDDARTISLKFRVPGILMRVPLLCWVVFAVIYGAQQMDILRADAHVIQGMMAGQHGDSNQAIREYRQATTLNPCAPLAHSQLALEFLKSSKPDSALAALETLEKKYPGFPKAGLMRAIAHLSLKQPIEALAEINGELERRTHPEAYFIASHIHKALGDTLAEREALTRMLGESMRAGVPHNMEYGVTRLRLLTKGDEETERIRIFYEALLERFSDERTLLTNLSRLYTSQGDTVRAQVLMQRLQSLPRQNVPNERAPAIR